MRITLDINGTLPLLAHSDQLSDPLNPIARAMKQISGKRKKTDEDFEALARLEFEGGLYLSPVVGPYIPGRNIRKCFIEGGRITKQGKQVERGLFITDAEVPLIYKGPRDIDALWADPNFRSRMSVKVATSRVMRTRPMFREWALQCEAELDEGMLNLEAVEQIGTDAGNMVGLGDFRPDYGLFVVTVTAATTKAKAGKQAARV